MWTAVHDATVPNGTLKVIPDCFRALLEHSRDPFSDHHIRCYLPEERAVEIALPAGGVAFFAYGTSHATGTNTTDHERAGVALHFLRADYAPDRDYRPYLTGPQATGGLREYGETVAGTWEREVERALVIST
jgi:ectoine hydroxylase-related dioxygenase (phytanoyl-CoA dioxygenase family)